MDEHCEDHSAHERAIRMHDERLDSHSRQLDELRDCVVRLTTLQEQEAEWRSEMEKRVSELEDKPAEMWEHVVRYALTGTIGAAVGMLAAHLGIM